LPSSYTITLIVIEQERAYNPYYTLVCQQLCRLSHSYKITLQFSLWDFLRDMGEKTVGGAAVVKNADDADDFDVKSISETRIKNVANAYAWWIAKDCLTLLVLKVGLLFKCRQ
jgi:nucleolar MIF4G domain-containing protein 1